eukprot:TRINITY_DN7796_c0_g1_i1.p1 TRINITY_DN7796_c0_g1~~TRINITY_DN7796_c0_g1_i1.p1  ORF type:complete len:188 (+),score=4.12 TRINITY_DN7796_c0_g1_i1:54-617(+)
MPKTLYFWMNGMDRKEKTGSPKASLSITDADWATLTINDLKNRVIRANFLPLSPDHKSAEIEIKKRSEATFLHPSLKIVPGRVGVPDVLADMEDLDVIVKEGGLSKTEHFQGGTLLLTATAFLTIIPTTQFDGNCDGYWNRRINGVGIMAIIALLIAAIIRRCRNINLLPISYASLPRLRGRLTLLR